MNYTHPFLLHVNHECPFAELTDAEEVYVLVPVELLWRLCRIGEMRRCWDECFNVVREQ